MNQIVTALARRVHYGWIVLAVTFLTMLVTAGAMGAPGVLIAPLQREYGWSTADISAALALRLVLFGLMAPFAAALLNHFGLRRMMLAALALIVGGLAGTLAMTRVWQLVVLWGIVVGVGTGLTATVLGVTVATRWFTHRRGLVVGLLAASSATGQLAILPLVASVSERYGWRPAVLLVCGALTAAAVAALLLMRDRPSDMGLAPYGERAVVPPPPVAGLPAMLASPLHTLRDAARVPSFWVLFATFFVCGASTNGLVQTHFVALCGDHGMAPVAAASVLAMMGMFDFAGTVGSGWLSDRFDNRWLLFWYYGLRGASLLSLPFVSFSMGGLTPFAIFYGLDWVATVPPTVKLVTERFGRERAGLAFGWVFTGHQLGAATAAYGAGLSRTALGNYMPAFVAAGSLCVLAALLIVSLDRRATVTEPVVIAKAA